MHISRPAPANTCVSCFQVIFQMKISKPSFKVNISVTIFFGSTLPCGSNTVKLCTLIDQISFNILPPETSYNFTVQTGAGSIILPLPPLSRGSSGSNSAMINNSCSNSSSTVFLEIYVDRSRVTLVAKRLFEIFSPEMSQTFPWKRGAVGKSRWKRN